MNSDKNPIARLLSSSKALVVLVVTAFVLVAVAKGTVPFHDASDFLKYLLGTWLLAQGAEDAAKHFNGRTPGASEPKNGTST